ncbi:unnamed protein product [Caenorhabditis brenneri]
MDAAFFATIYSSIMNANATGAPLVLPIIPAATTPSTRNPGSTSNLTRKYRKESERRDRTNQRFAVLQELVAKDSNGKMSQANILEASLKAAIKTKREFYSDPRSRGLNAALEKIKQLSLTHLGSLNFPSYTKFTYAQRLDIVIEDFLDMVLPVFIPKVVPGSPPVSPTSAAPPSPFAQFNADRARKDIRMIREQARRDKLADGFSLLQQFIAENHLVPSGNEKIQILECIIEYLKEKPVPNPSQIDSAEFENGFTQGKLLGQNLIVAFFKSDVHLFAHHISLINLIESQLGPIDSSTNMVNLKLGNAAVMKFKSFHPTILDLIDLITPPSTVPSTPVRPPAPAPIPKFFRPWE